jgi:hypothetical protein
MGMVASGSIVTGRVPEFFRIAQGPTRRGNTVKRNVVEKLAAELFLVVARLGGRLKALPADADTPELSNVESALKDAITSLRRASNALDGEGTPHGAFLGGGAALPIDDDNAA